MISPKNGTGVATCILPSMASHTSWTLHVGALGSHGSMAWASELCEVQRDIVLSKGVAAAGTAQADLFSEPRDPTNMRILEGF